MRCARRSRERAPPPRAPILAAPLPRPLRSRQWSGTFASALFPSYLFLCAGRSPYVMGDFPAGQQQPRAGQTVGSASRTRVLGVRARATAVCGRVAA